MKQAPAVGEILISELDPKGWVTIANTGGLRVYKFWENPKTGASICLLDVPKGARIPIRHRHASNQFMYCIKGVYEYLEPGLLLNPGSFYMNPKGNPHGPTVARANCIMLEIYDGPHYFERPSFHTAATVGRIAGAKKRPAKKPSGKSEPAKRALKARAPKRGVKVARGRAGARRPARP